MWPELNEAEPVALLTAAHRSSNEALLAAADEFGGVRVYRYPCLENNAAFLNLPAHSMHVTKVRFNSDDSALFTLGGTDRALVQWNIRGTRTQRVFTGLPDGSGEAEKSDPSLVDTKK